MTDKKDPNTSLTTDEEKLFQIMEAHRDLILAVNGLRVQFRQEGYTDAEARSLTVATFQMAAATQRAKDAGEADI